MDLGQKERDPTTIECQDIAFLLVQAFDEPFADQSPEVVAHVPGRVRRTEQRGDEGPQLCVGQAIGCPEEMTERVERTHVILGAVKDRPHAHIDPFQTPERALQVGQALVLADGIRR